MSRYQTASKVTTHRSIIAMIKAKSKNPIPEAVTKIVNNETEESTKFMCERCNKLKNPKLKVASTRQFCSCSNSYRIMHSPFIGALVNKKLALNDTFVSRKNSRAKSINFNAVSEKTLNATVINLTNQHRFKASSAHESVRSQNLPCQDIKNEILDNEYRYLVFKGNNSSLIEEVLALRSEWTSENKAKKNIQFIWHPTSAKIRFDRMMPYLPTQIVNHFEFHNQLSNKLYLYNNMASYCKLKSIEVTKIMPVTFPINLESKDFTSQMCKFNGHFKNFSKDSRNIWILKPSGFNRGRGIHVFNDILRLRTLLNEAQNTVQAKTKPIFAKKTSNSLKFVIQKYIEDPMLIEGRKFDIRVWVLVTQEFDCFMFTQGYLRTSCELFTLNDESLNSDFVHLTNNAIQKEAKTYGQFEAGNQLSFEWFQKYMEVKYPNAKNCLGRILNSIKDMIAHSLRAVKGKLNPNIRQHCFEIFGYDFIIDSNMKPWLIECNTNPCLELSSPLLQQLIPRMIHDAFKLTLDIIFPSKSNKNPSTPTITTLPDCNLWEPLASLKKKNCYFTSN